MRKIKRFFKFIIVMCIICGAGYFIYNNTDLFVERCTVNFDSAGAEIEKDKIRVEKDGTITLPEPTKEGYTFEGWYSQGTKWTSDMPVTADLELVARWTALKYDITFIVDGVHYVQKFDYDTMPTYSGTPTKTSTADHIEYVFDKWEPTLSKVTGDTTYTAKFTEKTKKNIITLTSNIDNAGEITGEGEYVHKTEATITATPNVGYRFLGWYDENDNLYSSEQNLIITSIESNLTLTAKFEMIMHKIAFVINDVSTEIEFQYGKMPIYPETPTKESSNAYTTYEFTGWSPELEIVTEDATYVAEFNEIIRTHKIQVAISPTDAGTVTGSGIYNYYTTATLTATANEGYEFVGWFNARDNSTYASTKTIIIEPVTVDKSFIAGFRPINYTISYNLDGGEVSSNNPTSYTIETFGFTLNNPTKEGYKFLGWTGTGYSSPTKSVSINMGTTGELSFTANWQVITYSITYNLDSGTATNPNIYTIETDTFTLNNPTKTNYIFLGWTGSNLSEVTETVTIVKGTTGNLIFTANYKINEPITLTIKTTNDIVLDSITQLAYTTIYQPDINDYGMTGYEFEGWYLDSDCNEIFDFDTMPDKNTTIYAKFGDYFLDAGFIPYLDEFNYYISKNKVAEINSFAELVAFIDYCNFNYISINIYFTTTYTTISTNEIDKALDECSFPLVFNVYGTESSQGVTYGIIKLDGEWKNNEAVITADPNKNYTYSQINSVFKSSYTSTRLSTNTLFNINKVDKTLEVETSNQLVYALEKGYRPICVSGSPAESVYNKAKSVLNRICDDTMTDIEKAKAIYDWLINNVDYDNRVLTLTQNSNTTPYWPSYDAFYAEGVFDNGVAVCDGIAKSLLIMCKIENIPVVRTKGDGHGWNKIYINNAWYGIDATHGDVEITTLNKSISTYSSFLFTDSFKTSVGYTDILNDEEISCTTIYNYYDLTTYTYTYYDATQGKFVNEEFDLQIDDADELTLLFKYIETLNLSSLSTFTIEFSYAGSDVLSIIQTAMNDADVSWSGYQPLDFDTTSHVTSYVIIAMIN